MVAPCSEPSVLSVIQSALYAALGYRHAFLLESVVPLADVVKRFLCTVILRASTTVVFHGRPGLFALLSSPVLAFFLRVILSLLILQQFLRRFVFVCFRAALTAGCLFTAKSYKCKNQTSNQIFNLLHWWWHDEGIAHTIKRPFSRLSNYFWSL